MKIKLIIFLVAVSLTALLGVISWSIGSKYYQNNVYFYDAASYMQHNVYLSQQLENHSSSEVVISEIQSNNYIFRTLPLIIFAPCLLKSQWAHFFTTLPMLCLFLCLLGWLVYKKTAKILFPISVMCLFASLPILLHPTWGINAYWLDLSAGFFMASAAICLYFYHLYTKLKYLLLFVAFFSFAVMSRYIMIVYETWLFTLPLLLVFYLHYKKNKNFKSSIIIPGSIVLGGIVILCGWFLIINFQHTYFYYTQLGYSLNYSWKDSVYSFYFMLRDDVKHFDLAISLILIFIIMFSFIQMLRKKHTDCLLLGWFLIAFPILWFLILHMYGTPHTQASALPLLFACAFMCFTILSKRILIILSTMFLVISASSLIFTYTNQSNTCTNPSIHDREIKQLFDSIASHLHDSKEVKWASFFNECDALINLHVFYKYGTMPVSDGNLYFSVHQTYFTAMYPQLSAPDVAQKVWRNVDSSLQKVVVFNDSKVVDTMKFIDNEYSRKAAKIISDSVKNNNHWTYKTSFNSAYYSKLDLYEKTYK